MRTVGTEELDRQWSTPRAGRKPARPPISVVVGVISVVAASVWIDALEPPLNPSLTIDLMSDWGTFLFSAAIIVGTLLGVRALWALNIAFSTLGTAFVLGSAFQDPQAQAIGGTLLFVLGLVFLLLPSSAKFEQRRLRLVLV